VTSANNYLRFPHIQQDLLTFVAEDDVWLAPAQGGRAWRLSADDTEASRPRLSRDGLQVAWTGLRGGANEVYLAATDGGVSRRLTHWGVPNTAVCGFDPSGNVLAVTSAGQPFSFWTWAHAIRTDPAGAGPVTRPLPFGLATDLAVDTDAVAVLTGSQGEPAWRKRYRGGTAGRLYLRTQSGAYAVDAGQGFRRVADLGGHLACPMLVGGRLAFICDHEGTGNIYSVDLTGGDLRRHTDHDGPYAREASTDGRRIVYNCRGELWLLDGLDAPAPRPLDVSLGSAVAGRSPRLISAADHIGSLACDQTGQASAVEVRGTVHWLTHRDGPARALDVTPGARARQPQPLGRDGLAVWVTDADGPDALQIGSTDGPAPDGSAAAHDNAAHDNAAGDAADKAAGDASDKAAGDAADNAAGARDGRAGGGRTAPRRLASGAIGTVASLAASPDGSTIAVAARDGNLRLVAADTGAVTDLARSGNGEIRHLAWSPDSAWLAWSQPVESSGEDQLRKIGIGRISDRAVYDVTDGRFADSDVVFSEDGRYLAFLSKRNFDPVYDAHVFDLSFPYGARPYLVPLAASTTSPFAPMPGGRPFAEQDGRDAPGQDAAKKHEDGTGNDGDHAAKNGVPEVTVDPEQMAARVVALPVPEARYAQLRSVKGGLAWLREPVAGNLGIGGARLTDDRERPALERFDFRRQTVKVLQDQVDWFEASGDGTRLVVKDGDSLVVVPADRSPDPDNPDDKVYVDTSRARFLADPVALWRHAFDEAGRWMAHDYWAPDMAEVDWPAVLAEYRPLVERIASPRDFADLLWETFGELASSHAYVWRHPDDAGNESAVLGLLGADIERDGDGSWTVARIIPGESSDPRASSPLAAPGAQVLQGDRLLAVDGQPVGPAGPGPLLVGAAGKPVELTLASGPRGEQRRVVVTPLRSETRLRYHDWVARKRAEVRKLSGGRLGYLHIPDMVSEGWADFHRDLRTEMRMDGLVVDVRCNRGGHTSQLVIEKLARRIIGWDVPRDMEPLSYPQDAPRGPMVALSDEQAGSDGDIVTAAIKILKLAPVVGARTWGGVIGIDDAHELVDGTLMTVPRYPFFFDTYGLGVENHGVDPDVEVLISPDDWAAGHDTQLETAVEMALQALATTSRTQPRDLMAGRPSWRRPPLPPRPGSQ
jgi:tricorn protease